MDYQKVLQTFITLDARVETKIDHYVTGGTGVSISSGGQIAIGQAVATNF